ncbi:MAG: metallophosphoesterase, partial [Deltaproteobacteria bacterium]|nr:metallophosphoesterase [Deltaproteobacteria bacterium]
MSGSGGKRPGDPSEEPVQKIFVGDVQGCGDEFEELVGRAKRSFDTDFELWCVGDLINRGPKNLLALRLMRELVAAGRGQLVLGNHEIGLLRIWLGL